MTITYTPEPWKLKVQHSNGKPLGVVKVFAGLESVICLFPPGIASTAKDRQGNAQLIANAARMYKLISAFVAATEEEWETVKDSHSPDIPVEFMALHEFVAEIRGL